LYMYRRGIEMIEKSCNMFEMLSNKFTTEMCSKENLLFLKEYKKTVNPY
jgi:hypothetical protein